MPNNPSQSNNNSQTGSVMQEERIKTPLVIPKMKNESDKEQILVKVSVSKEFPNNSNQTENQDPFQGYLSKSQENSKGAQSDKNINIMENYIPSEPVQYDSNLLYGFRAPTSPCNPSSSPIKQPQQSNFFNSKDTSRFGESPASRRESIGDRSGSKLFLSYEKHSNFGNGIRNETGSRLEENAVFPVEMSFNEENEDLFEKDTGIGKNESIGKSQSILDSELKRSLQLESENNRQMSSTKTNQDQENSLRSQEQSQKNQSVTKSVAKEDFPETGRQSLSKINEQHQTNHFEQSEAEPSQIRHIPIFTPSKLEKADQETKITIYFNPFENRRSSVNKDTLNPSQSNRASLDKVENPFTASKEKNSMVVENENIYHSEFDANEDVENDKPTFGTTSPWENKQENKSPLKENTFLLNSSKSQRGGNEDNSAMQIEDPHGNDNRITTEANPMPLRHAKSPNYLEK